MKTLQRMLTLAIFAMVGTTPAAGYGAANVHRVQQGDTLWELARAHGCTVDELRAENALAVGGLRVGMDLRLPRCTGVQRAMKRADATKVHVVSRGDTLSSMAKRYGTTVDLLRAANGLRSDTIVVGQSLRVPHAAATPSLRLVAGQSVGAPQRGKLVGGVQLPRSRGYYRRRLHRTFAAAHVVDRVRVAIDAVRAAHPRVHPLAIGDLSDRDGGYLSGHASHQSGRDVDLGFYFKSKPSGYPKEFKSTAVGKLDTAAMWTLISALYEQSKHDGGPAKVFLDYRVQKKIYEYARSRKVSSARLKKIFQYPAGRWAGGRLVQHLRNHHDHLHVRFACPPKDDVCKGG